MVDFNERLPLGLVSFSGAPKTHYSWQQSSEYELILLQNEKRLLTFDSDKSSDFVFNYLDFINNEEELELIRRKTYRIIQHLNESSNQD